MTIPAIASYPLPDAAGLTAPRVAWRPDPARAVLLIHDLQDYFLDFYARDQAPVPELLAHIRALRDACDRAGVPVVYTAQPPRQSPQERGLLNDWWGAGLTARPERAAIVAPLSPRPGDTVLTKWRYSAFVSTDLQTRLEASGRDQLIVCGVYAHIGCMMTAADAFMRDVQAFLVADAVADFGPDEHRQALAYVQGRCGVVVDHRDCIDCLAQPALPSSLDALRGQLAALLEIPPETIRDHDHPLHLGLDSVRLMHLIERWSADGAELRFVELAERASVAEWWSLIEARRVAA